MKSYFGSHLLFLEGRGVKEVLLWVLVVLLDEFNELSLPPHCPFTCRQGNRLCPSKATERNLQNKRNIVEENSLLLRKTRKKEKSFQQNHSMKCQGGGGGGEGQIPLLVSLGLNDELYIMFPHMTMLANLPDCKTFAPAAAYAKPNPKPILKHNQNLSSSLSLCNRRFIT